FDIASDPNDVKVGYTIDYAARGLQANQLALGGYFNGIQSAGSSPKFATLMTTAFSAPDVPSLQGFYTGLTPAGALAPSASALVNNLDFSNALLGCNNGSSLASAGCTWGTFGETHGSQMASFGGIGFAQSMSGVSAGYEHAMSGRTLMGGALRYDTGSLSADGNQSLSGNAYTLGLVAKQLVGTNDAISANVIGGAANYASLRTPGLAGATAATGNETTTYVGAHVRAEREVHTGTMTMRPFVDLGMTRVNASALNETGADVLDAKVAAHGETFTTAQSGISLEGLWHSAAMTLQPSLDFSVTQLLGNAQSSTLATLAGAPSGVAPFVLANTFDRTRFSLVPSIRIFEKNNIDLRLSGGYQFSDSWHSFGADAQISKHL
ncbi:MAG TPA: autotransporter outer membrane beta-barrel domain-containing protein, partial [Candidatus Baltobacteraceae bacterium]